eukprot:TRINITY_DN20892_c0_g1_i2.p1 TRINITY_DN20892_c0_g1~~TRINITY_DN20892_c0_g1_i2.p1  ORF type:complete len:223 (-),score=33.69 TRINITY_DN20892_c0_g1_i2:2-670(-)
MVLDAPLIKVALPVRPDDVDSEEGESSSPGFGGSAASCRPGAEGPADSFAALKLSFSGLLEARGEEGDRDSPSAGKPSRDDGLIAQSIGGWDEGDDAVLAATAEPCSASALGKRATRAAAEKQAAPWRQGGAADLLAVVAEIRAATASLSVAAKGRQLRSGVHGLGLRQPATTCAAAASISTAASSAVLTEPALGSTGPCLAWACLKAGLSCNMEADEPPQL